MTTYADGDEQSNLGPAAHECFRWKDVHLKQEQEWMSIVKSEQATHQTTKIDQSPDA